jgi:hypothetical protein
VGHLRLDVFDSRVCVVFFGGGVIVVEVWGAVVMLVG